MLSVSTDIHAALRYRRKVRALGLGGTACMAVTSSAVIATPLTILQTAPPSLWCRSDVVTIDTGVSIWPDLSGNSKHGAQATSGFQPAYLPTGGANGRPGLSFDGTDDYIVTSLTPTVAAATPTWYAAILSFTFTSSGRQLLGTNSARLAIQSGASAGLLLATNGVASSTLSISGFKRIRAYFSSSAADHFDVGSTTRAGSSLGANAVSGTFTVGARFSGTTAAKFTISEIVVCPAEPPAGELAALDTYFTGLYGSAVIT